MGQLKRIILKYSRYLKFLPFCWPVLSDFDKIYVIRKEFSKPFGNFNKNYMLSYYKDLQNVKIFFIFEYPEKWPFYFLYFSVFALKQGWIYEKH